MSTINTSLPNDTLLTDVCVAKNYAIEDSIYKALDAAILGYYPFTIMLEVGSSLATSTNQLFSTPWSSVGKTMTSKFARVLSEKVVSGDCSDTESLNYFQQNAFCIDEGTYEAVAFRASVAFVAGSLSSMAFKGVPLFAIYDGLNAALYDGVSELKKVDDIQKNDTLKTTVDFLDTYGAFVFEGLDGLLKVKSVAAKLSAELIAKQAASSNAESRLNIAKEAVNNKMSELLPKMKPSQIEGFKKAHNELMGESANAESALKAAKDQVQTLAAKLTETEATKLHGFIGGYLADLFTGPIKTYQDKVFYAAVDKAKTIIPDTGNSSIPESISEVYTSTITKPVYFSSYDFLEPKFDKCQSNTDLSGCEQKISEEANLV